MTAEWAKLVKAARRKLSEAREAEAAAWDRRCPVEDWSGAQCTGDRGSDHEHRYNPLELP